METDDISEININANLLGTQTAAQLGEIRDPGTGVERAEPMSASESPGGLPETQIARSQPRVSG